MTRLLLVGLFALVAGGPALSAMEDMERMAKLARLPVTVYPDHGIRGTMLVTLLNEKARADDAVVVSHTDALKVSARIADLRVTTAEVWVHVPGEVNLRDTHRKNFEGAKGVVFVPPAIGRGDFRVVRSVSARLREDAHQTGMRFIMGMEENDLRIRANAAEMAREADIVTIYLPRKLKAGGKEFRAMFERVVADARGANPQVQVELALTTANSLEATRFIAGLAFANSDLIDRLAFFCEDSPESLDSLRTLLTVLRPPDLAGPAATSP